MRGQRKGSVRVILSVSRRTDIPAWYSPWFFRRLQEGYVFARNPRNPKQIRRLAFDPDSVDGIVFWTKNPIPMLPCLSELRDYAYYFQFTLTPYGCDIEANLPDKQSVLEPALLRLSDEIGPERVVWRYDPILLSGEYTMEFHIDAFARMASRFRGCVHRATISFVDMYRGMRSRYPLTPVDESAQKEIAKAFSAIAAENGMRLDACCEDADFSQFGIGRAHCIDAELLSALSERPVAAAKDVSQRPGCGCAKSVDIGVYNSCRNGCVYCYANYAPAVIEGNIQKHDPASPLLIGTPPEPE